MYKHTRVVLWRVFIEITLMLQLMFSVACNLEIFMSLRFGIVVEEPIEIWKIVTSALHSLVERLTLLSIFLKKKEDGIK